MLQNSRVATSIISDLLTENQQKERRGGGESFGFVCDALLSLYLIKIPNLFYYFLSKTYGNRV